MCTRTRYGCAPVFRFGVVWMWVTRRSLPTGSTGVVRILDQLFQDTCTLLIPQGECRRTGQTPAGHGGTLQRRLYRILNEERTCNGTAWPLSAYLGVSAKDAANPMAKGDFLPPVLFSETWIFTLTRTTHRHETARPCPMHLLHTPNCQGVSQTEPSVIA